MAENYQIDKIDKQIIFELQKNARRPFLDIARKIGVSGGTVHQRVERLREKEIIKGSKVIIDPQKLGFGVEVLLGLHLVSAKKINKVVEKLEKFNEVVEAMYTTGNYALFIRIHTQDINSYHEFLVKKLQAIDEIQSTESFICLNHPIQRELTL